MGLCGSKNVAEESDLPFRPLSDKNKHGSSVDPIISENAEDVIETLDNKEEESLEIVGETFEELNCHTAESAVCNEDTSPDSEPNPDTCVEEETGVTKEDEVQNSVVQEITVGEQETEGLDKKTEQILETAQDGPSLIEPEGPVDPKDVLAEIIKFDEIQPKADCAVESIEPELQDPDIPSDKPAMEEPETTEEQKECSVNSETNDLSVTSEKKDETDVIGTENLNSITEQLERARQMLSEVNIVEHDLDTIMEESVTEDSRDDSVTMATDNKVDCDVKVTVTHPVVNQLLMSDSLIDASAELSDYTPDTTMDSIDEAETVPLRESIARTDLTATYNKKEDLKPVPEADEVCSDDNEVCVINEQLDDGIVRLDTELQMYMSELKISPIPEVSGSELVGCSINEESLNANAKESIKNNHIDAAVSGLEVSDDIVKISENEDSDVDVLVDQCEEGASSSDDGEIVDKSDLYSVKLDNTQGVTDSMVHYDMLSGSSEDEVETSDKESEDGEDLQEPEHVILSESEEEEDAKEESKPEITECEDKEEYKDISVVEEYYEGVEEPGVEFFDSVSSEHIVDDKENSDVIENENGTKDTDNKLSDFSQTTVTKREPLTEVRGENVHESVNHSISPSGKSPCGKQASKITSPKGVQSNSRSRSKRKNTSKSKEKKQQRKLENAKYKASKEIVDAANQLSDPMEQLAPFRKYDRNGLNLQIKCSRVADLDPETVDWAYSITKQNMQTLYEESDWGWDDKQKREEMTEEAAWYLVAQQTEDNKPVACVHFRFDIDEGDEVLYCYEIQLEKEVRRKGLGKFLMQILELMAFKTHMKKVMLTIFKQNTEAQNFFLNKLKYETDETNPEETMAEAMFDEEGYTYQIVSKKIGQKKSSTSSSKQPVNGHSQTVSVS